jgi:hypothetical protein
MNDERKLIPDDKAILDSWNLEAAEVNLLP